MASHAGKKNRQREGIRSQETIARIISEATRLFAARGYDGTSIKQICIAAGASISAVNYHFESKEQLFRIIIEQFLSDLFESTRQALLPPQSSEDFRARLDIFVRQTMETISKQPDVIAIIHREMERSREVFSKTIMKHREALVGFLSIAVEKGIISSDIDPEIAGDFLMGLISLGNRRANLKGDLYGKTPASRQFRERWISQMLRLFFGGVMSGDAEP